MTNNVMLNHVSHGLVASDAADRVSLIGGSPSKRSCSEEILNVFPEADGRKRKVGARETLCASEDVWHDTIVGLVSEHLTATADASHDLIDNQENVVLVAESTDALDHLRRVN